ncbi:MAG: glycosyltransferase family 2 protein [Candidatus Micrarchaeaceae archaeon]
MIVDLIIIAGLVLIAIGSIYTIYQFPIMLSGYLNSKTQQKIEDPEFEELVSIIVPVKNEEKVIGRCLDSILKQSYANFEVIVIEDGSIDTSLSICKAYSEKDQRIKCFHRDQSTGKPAALNYALQFCNGDVIATFDADSVLDPDNLINALTELYNKHLDALQGQNSPINYRENLMTRMAIIDLGLIKYSLLGRTGLNLFLPLGGTNQFFKRSCIEALGGWNEQYLTEDLEISVRMNSKNMRTEYSTNVRCGQETPATMREFKKQRIRWMRGYHQVLFHSTKNMKSAKDLDALIVTSAPLVYTFWFVSMILLGIGGLIEKIPHLQLMFLLYAGLFLLILNVTSLFLITFKNYRFLVYIPIAYIYWFILSVISLYSLILELTGRERMWTKVSKTGNIDH